MKICPVNILRNKKSKSEMQKPAFYNTAFCGGKDSFCRHLEINAKLIIEEKLKSANTEALSRLKNTLGQDFFDKIEWEQLINKNDSHLEIKKKIEHLNDISVFFSRISFNENRFGKDFKWAEKIHELSVQTEGKIKKWYPLYGVVKETASNYNGYESAFRKSISFTPFDEKDMYKEYYLRFMDWHGVKRKSPYVNIKLTQIGNFESNQNVMIHPEAFNSTSYGLFSNPIEGVKIAEEKYDLLHPYVEKVNHGGKLSDEEIKDADDKISEMSFLITNVMPYDDGSCGVNDVVVRSLYKSLGLKLPPLKKGISLDLEAFCTDLETYKKNWRNLFENN